MGWAWGRQWNGRTSWTRGWGRRETVQLWASREQVLMSVSLGTVRSCLPSHAYVQGQTPRTGAGGSGSWAGASPGSVCGPFLAAERVLPRNESSMAGVSAARGPAHGGGQRVPGSTLGSSTCTRRNQRSETEPEEPLFRGRRTSGKGSVHRFLGAGPFMRLPLPASVT